MHESVAGLTASFLQPHCHQEYQSGFCRVELIAVVDGDSFPTSSDRIISSYPCHSVVRRVCDRIRIVVVIIVVVAVGQTTVFPTGESEI
jgi:hypothetical protein